jgi:hypothetical protein
MNGWGYLVSVEVVADSAGQVALYADVQVEEEFGGANDRPWFRALGPRYSPRVTNWAQCASRYQSVPVYPQLLTSLTEEIAREVWSWSWPCFFIILFLAAKCLVAVYAMHVM